MNIKEIIYNTAIFLHLEDVIELIDSDGAEVQGGKLIAKNSQTNPDTITAINHLVRCVNLVLGEIATEHLPLIKKEKIQASNKCIDYSELSENIINMLSIKNNLGANVNFRQLPYYASVHSDGEYELEYTYLPKKVQYDEQLDLWSKIKEREIAYGVACEYSIISGMYDEAVLWDKRFKDSMANALSSGKKAVLPTRRWY